MAVALTPNAFLSRTTTTAWSGTGGIYYSYCGWRRIDVDRGEFTVLTYLAHLNVGSGIQFTALPDRQLVVYNVTGFADLLAGTGPTLAVGTWYFLGVTTIEASEPGGIEVYYAAEGDPSLTQVNATVLGAYGYNWHGIGARPGTDGQDDVWRLHGSAAYDRTWQNTTLTPTEMLAEFQSATPVRTTGLWSAWPMATAATATTDASGNSRPLTATAGTGTITDTDAPIFGGGDPNEGTGALAVDLSLAATGETVRSGTGDLPIDLAIAAVGSTARSGSGDLPVAVDLAAVGQRTPVGAADHPVGLSLNAVGVAARGGIGGLPVALALSATGQAPVPGAAAGTGNLPVTVTVAAAGSTQHSGEAAFTLNLGLTAAGPTVTPPGRVRSITRAHPTAETTTRARPTVDMEVTTS